MLQTIAAHFNFYYQKYTISRKQAPKIKLKQH